MLHPEIIGFRIEIKGKIGGHMRTTVSRSPIQGLYSQKLPLQVFTNTIMYGKGFANTYTGTFGIHVWLQRVVY